MYVVTLTASATGSVIVQDPRPTDGRFSETLAPSEVRVVEMTDSQFDNMEPVMDDLVTAGLLTYTYLMASAAASQLPNDSSVTGVTIADALDALAAGGGGGGATFGWTYRTPTADANPGAGNFRLNNADPALATFLYISITTDDGVDVSSILAQLRDKVEIAIDPPVPAEAMAVYECSGTPTDATTYYKVPLTFVDKGPDAWVGDMFCDISFISAFAHAMGGDLHEPSTIAALNTKISDGDVDKTTDPRTPTYHAGTHNGGVDPVTPVGIGAEPAFSKNPAFNKAFGTGAGTVCEGNDSRLSASGGQTDTVAGATGITNTGNNVDAVLAPTYGSASNTVCQGNDSRLSDDRDPNAHAASHNGGVDPVTPAGIGAEPAFSKNPAFNKAFGTGSGTVCEGNDARLSDTRVPTAHAASHNGGADPVTPAGIGAEPAFSKNPAFNKAFGTGSGTVCEGNDARLSDARTPTQHALDSASLHAALSDIVTYNVSAVAHGFLPKFPDIIEQLFRGDGTWGIPQQFLDMQDPTGIVDRTQSTIAFADGSRTFTIAPVGGSFEYYIKGTKYSKTSSPPNSIIIDDTEGMHFIYYEDGTLSKTTTFDISLILEKALLAVIYWDATNKASILFGDERHGIGMPGITHLAKHVTQGTLIERGGLALSGMDVNGSGDDNSAAQFGYEGGAIWDEDIRFAISADTTPAQIPVFYKTGASGLWRKYTATDYPVRSYAGVGTNRLAYNEFTGGVWTQTEVPNTQFTLTHILATNDASNPVIVIQGEAAYTSLGNARTGAEVEMLAITTGGLPIVEFQPMASVIYQCRDNYTNAVQARVRDTGDGADYVDWRHVSGGSTGGLAAPSTDYLVRAANDFGNFANKVTPAASDRILVEDSADSYGKVYVNASAFGGGGGGQTNTVAGATGISNTGDNVDAVLAPTYGSASNTICQGNDARLSDTRTPTSHAASHNGGADPVTPAGIGAEPAFSKNTGFNKDLGTGSGNVCVGNDARLSDSRTPTSHASSHNGGADPVTPAGIGAEPAFSKNTGFNKDLGTGSGEVCEGNDSRLSNARTPTSHASSHNGGADPVTPVGIGAEPAFSKNAAFNKAFGTGAGTVCEGNDSRLGASGPPTVIQGSEEAEGTTTSATYVEDWSFAPTLEATTKYAVWYCAELSGGSTTYYAKARIQINDTTTIAEQAFEIESDANDEWSQISGVYFLTTTSAGTYNFDFDFFCQGGSDDAKLRRKRIVLMKVVE